MPVEAIMSALGVLFPSDSSVSNLSCDEEVEHVSIAFARSRSSRTTTPCNK